MNTAIQAATGGGAIVAQGLTEEQKDLVKRTIARGATDDELKIFLHVCEKRKVDPFSKMLYLVKRWNSDTRQEEMALQNSIDYSRLVADRHGDYEGQAGPQWCGPDAKWVDVWLAKDPPRAARVGVWRKGFREPLWAVANWDSYVQKKKDGSVTKFWASMGALMLSKCAEALALRRAFPEDLSGMYTPEEMAQASNALTEHDAVTGEGAAIQIQPPTKPQAAPTRTVTVEASKPAETPPAKPQEPQRGMLLFEGCVKDHPGILVPERIYSTWDDWKTQIAFKKKRADSKSALADKTWEHASLGSPNGDRMRELTWIVEEASLNKLMAQEPLTDFHLKGAWALKVMLDRHLDELGPFAPPDYGHELNADH